jgi:arginyl-tRNA synthetase
LYAYPETIETASEDLNPSLIANYIYELVKVYNRFYQETPILKEENQALRLFRLHLSAFTARTVSDAMSLLGINMPERM